MRPNERTNERRLAAIRAREQGSVSDVRQRETKKENEERTKRCRRSRRKKKKSQSKRGRKRERRLEGGWEDRKSPMSRRNL